MTPASSAAFLAWLDARPNGASMDECMRHTGTVDVLVGYLVTHSDGFAARLAPDFARAQLYAARNHALLEPIFVRRNAQQPHQAGAGGAIGGAVVPG